MAILRDVLVITLSHLLQAGTEAGDPVGDLKIPSYPHYDCGEI